MGIKARWIGLEDVLGKIHVMPEKLSKAIKEIIDRNDRLLETHIKQDLMQGGTNDTQLAGRTGQLASSTRAINATIEDGGARVSGGINFGQKYARVHIGPKGQITTIRPVNRQWLTIPLGAAKTSSGALRGAAQSGMYGQTFFANSKAGNLILFGKLAYQKGKRAGQTHGDIVPLFVLKKEVKVKARLHPKDMFEWVQPKIVSEIKETIALYRGAQGTKI